MRPTVVDTMVLRKANAPLVSEPKANRDFAKRLSLLKAIQDGDNVVLLSKKLLEEYTAQIPEPRNEFIAAFLAIALGGDKCRFNWAPWPGRLDELRSNCRFPKEDTHLLRTGLLNKEESDLFSEEGRVLQAADCVRRNFGIHISSPV